MAGQYSHLQFFRRTPNELLARYFISKNIELGINFKELNKKAEDAIFQAFIKLPADQQVANETDFQNIHAMACDGGIQALIDESVFHKDEDFTKAIAAIDGFHAKAMWAFLEKQNYWRGAAVFLHADNISASYWEKSIPYILIYLKKIPV